MLTCIPYRKSPSCSSFRVAGHPRALPLRRDWTPSAPHAKTSTPRSLPGVRKGVTFQGPGHLEVLGEFRQGTSPVLSTVVLQTPGDAPEGVSQVNLSLSDLFVDLMLPKPTGGNSQWLLQSKSFRLAPSTRHKFSSPRF